MRREDDRKILTIHKLWFQSTIEVHTLHFRNYSFTGLMKTPIAMVP